MKLIVKRRVLRDDSSLCRFILVPRRYFQITNDVAEHSSRSIVDITNQGCTLSKKLDGNPPTVYLTKRPGQSKTHLDFAARHNCMINDSVLIDASATQARPYSNHDDSIVVAEEVRRGLASLVGITNQHHLALPICDKQCGILVEITVQKPVPIRPTGWELAFPAKAPLMCSGVNANATPLTTQMPWRRQLFGQLESLSRPWRVHFRAPTMPILATQCISDDFTIQKKEAHANHAFYIFHLLC